uniref:Uncharacterized protein n=1 Tax=Rhynchophorus ferrugineus TaxID=354439 RepID=A0A834LXS0_RHYFE|nr:hypothetical protein GWI33_000641 [Rhynchophorus ferrugineus]
MTTEMIERNKSEFLRRYVTMDETWLHHFTPKYNQQSSEWNAHYLAISIKDCNHSEIDCCRWNKRLPQIIKYVALCEETSTDRKHESCIVEQLCAEDFSKQLLSRGNRRVPLYESSGLISFPQNFCNFVSSKEKLTTKAFPNIIVNDKNILAANNKVEVT